MKFGDYNSAGDFKVVPTGTHVGVITGIAFLGLQPGSQMYPKPAYKLALTVSFPQHQTDDGSGDLTVTQQYTLSTSKKATLRKVVESIVGPFATEAEVNSFEFKSLLGKAGLFSIIHKQRDDKVFANVGGVIALPAGMPVQPSKNALRYFTPELPPNEFLQAYNALPEFLRKKWDERIPDEHRASSSAGEDVPV